MKVLNVYDFMLFNRELHDYLINIINTYLSNNKYDFNYYLSIHI